MNRARDIQTLVHEAVIVHSSEIQERIRNIIAWVHKAAKYWLMKEMEMRDRMSSRTIRTPFLVDYLNNTLKNHGEEGVVFRSEDVPEDSLNRHSLFIGGSYGHVKDKVTVLMPRDFHPSYMYDNSLYIKSIYELKGILEHEFGHREQFIRRGEATTNLLPYFGIKARALAKEHAAAGTPIIGYITHPAKSLVRRSMFTPDPSV